MTPRDAMQRHPAGKALPAHQARLVRSAARESLLSGIAGLTATLTIGLVAAVGYLTEELPVPVRLLMLVPIALAPAVAIQAVHGVGDARRLFDWARHFDHQALEATPDAPATTPNQRRTK